MTYWITTSEAAELTGYNTEYLRWLIRRGEVKARKFGVIWQVSRSSLLQYQRRAEGSSDKRHEALRIVSRRSPPFQSSVGCFCFQQGVDERR